MSVKKHLKKSGWSYIGESTDEENVHIFEKKIKGVLFEVLQYEDRVDVVKLNDNMEREILEEISIDIIKCVAPAVEETIKEVLCEN